MCTQHFIIVGVMEESVYWVIGETNPLGLPSPIFPWVLPLQAMHRRLFTLLLQRLVWKAEPTLQTPLCLVGCPDTKQFCRNEEVQSVDWEEKLFFQSESRDQGNFGRNVKLCSILDTHCINRRWYPKFSSQYFPWSYFWSQFIDWFCTSYNYRCNKTKCSTQVH